MTFEEIVASLYGSAAEIRYLADLAHIIPGFVYVFAAALILFAGLGWRKKQLTLFYSFMLIVLAVVFNMYIFLEHGIENAATTLMLVLAFPEISIHLVQSAAAIGGSLVEMAYITGKIRYRLAALVFPLHFIIIGYTNILHPHGPIHNEDHTFFHALMGAIMVSAGLFLIINRLLEGRLARVMLVLGVANIIGFSAMLISFRESSDAYEYAFPVTTTIGTANAVNVGTHGIIYMYDDYLVPQEISIAAGGTVTFIQVSDSWHDINSGPHPTHEEYPPLNIGFMRKGESRSITFLEPGVHGFHDHLDEEDEDLNGLIVVR
jgi:plastocyanin